LPFLFVRQAWHDGEAVRRYSHGGSRATCAWYAHVLKVVPEDVLRRNRCSVTCLCADDVPQKHPAQFEGRADKSMGVGADDELISIGQSD
jgi:hypothetical protein